MNIFDNIKRQYSAPGGYLEFLKIAIPLIISTSIGAIQLFINRTFLSWYSQEAFAASAPAGISNWAIITLFLGTLSYVDVFIAQYYGKKEYKSIGPAVWQGVYMSLVSAFIILCISFFSKSIFMNLGHPHIVACEEVKFFRVLCYGAFPILSVAALSGFYAGRGKTKVVLLVSACGVVINIILDFCLIFGRFGFPRAGVIGSAWSSNISSTIMFIIYIFMVISKSNNIYNVRCMKPDFNFMKKLLRYGFPNGVQFFFDMAGFGIFVSIVGRLGITELTASNLILNVNNVIIMPLVGSGMAISVIVGNYLGKNKASLAQRSVKSAAHIMYLYSVLIIFVLIFLPYQILYPFLYPFLHLPQALPMDQITPMTVDLLRILAIYIIFDATGIIFTSAIKGAGDTVFIMKRLTVLTVIFVIVPTYLIVVVFKLGIYVAWLFMLSYSITLAISFYYRYRSNKWKEIRVINMDVIDS
ncbi:MAG: MATE family efflux transporter [Endomicrobium sp.]|jgi:MATE family multidrug resistance protein|nr:MATE family efflux transporter [Endomicrobium sp.]